MYSQCTGVAGVGGDGVGGGGGGGAVLHGDPRELTDYWYVIMGVYGLKDIAFLCSKTYNTSSSQL